MRALIITVAGMSTRFNADLDVPTLKSIYCDEHNNSLLAMIVEKTDQIDEIIIVGGYKYDLLLTHIQTFQNHIKQKITTIFNPYFNEYGSGYSLYLGILALEGKKVNEIIFVEGDLYFEKKDFDKIIASNNDVITINPNPIYSKSAVVVYLDSNSQLRYVYNISHGLLTIKEPFQAVFNSGQIWKFTNIQKLFEQVKGLTSKQIEDTNLEIIQSYFKDLPSEQYEIIMMNRWINCNTVGDYKNIIKQISTGYNEERK